jgi:hypothetical protein
MIIAFWAFQKFKTEIVLTSFFHHFIMNDFDFVNYEGHLSQKDFINWINLFPVFPKGPKITNYGHTIAIKNKFR